MEEDLSMYKLASRGATLSGWLAKSPIKQQQRELQPLIYLFVRLPSADLPDGETSSLHFWSFYEDGRKPLSPSRCDTLGLPTELKLQQTWYNLWSCSTGSYKHIHQYQLYRGFDPTTTDFTRHLNYGVMFEPVSDDMDRFAEVQEEPNSQSDSYTEPSAATRGENTTTSQSSSSASTSDKKRGSSKASSSSKKRAKGKRTATAPKKKVSRPKKRPAKANVSAPSIGCSDSAIDPTPLEPSSSRYAAPSPTLSRPHPHLHEAPKTSAGVPETGTSVKRGKRKRDSIPLAEAVGVNERGKEEVVEELGRGKRRRVAVVREHLGASSHPASKLEPRAR
ncbi:hypothetical protein PQX77_006256 [Marasmius sp. AFHP31]|nr:hypothetical protein PQX77_006256 [Marasmius sp. AFHP31]